MGEQEQDLMAQLDAPVETAEAWVPEAGDKLIGSVKRLGSNDGGYGSYPIVTVVTEDGTTQKGSPVTSGTELSFHAYHSVASREIAEQSPQPGDRIGVAYQGKKAGKPGKNSFHGYRVVVQRGAGSIAPARASATEQSTVADLEALGATESGSNGIEW